MLHAASGYVLMALFAACALGATFLARRDPDLRLVGTMLIINFIFSNVIVFITRDPQARAGVFTMADILVAIAAYLAFALSARRPALVGVVAVCLVSICATIGYALVPHPSRETVNLWHLLTNGCFVLNCLLVGATGRRDAVGTDRFWPWPGRGGRAAQPHAVDG